MNKKRNIFAIKSFGSILISSLIILILLVFIALAYERINHWLWLVLLIMLAVIVLSLLIMYIKPLKNLKSKGINYLDVYLLSVSISFLVFGVICFPFFKTLFHVDQDKEWIPSIVSLSIHFLASIGFIARSIYVYKFANKLVKHYHLYDFAKGYLPDNPRNLIICDEDVNVDLFNRASLVDEITNALTRDNGDGKCVVAITGKWGNGKTTYLNIALDRIKEAQKDRAIICKSFSAWRYSDERSFLISIVKEIYTCLDIGSTYSEINGAILKYANVFVRNERLSLIESISANASIGDEKVLNVVNEYLVQNGKHLYFVIDNIDRASKEQIRFIYKAISDILVIKNVTFVCLYDEEYVENLFCDFNSGAYLDKAIDIKVRIPAPSKNKMFDAGYNAILNFVNKTDLSFRVDDLSQDDRDILSLSLKQINNVRTLILILNKFLNYIALPDSQLNPIDFLAINVIKETNHDLFEFIIENANHFVVVNGEYLPNYIFESLLDYNERTKKRNAFIEDNFELGKKYSLYKELLNKLFPRSLDKYGSLSSKETRALNAGRRICSGKYFSDYVTDNDFGFMVASSSISKVLDASLSYKELTDSFDSLFKSYADNEYSELLKLIEDIVDSYDDSNHKELLAWLLDYFIERYYRFDDVFGFMSLSSKNRCAIVVDKLLISVDKDVASKRIDDLGNDPHHLTFLAYIKYWNDGNIKYDNIGQDIDELLKAAIQKSIDIIIDKNIDPFSEDIYERGILWRIKDNTNESVFKSFVETVINPNNVFCFLNEFIGNGISTNKETPYTITIDKKNIEAVMSITDLLEIVSQAVCKNKSDEIVKHLFGKLLELDNNQNVYEEHYDMLPTFINDYYGKRHSM